VLFVVGLYILFFVACIYIQILKLFFRVNFVVGLYMYNIVVWQKKIFFFFFLFFMFIFFHSRPVNACIWYIC
jgi:hypothetical protein